MKTALITDTTGQDGAYLSEFLLDKVSTVNFDFRKPNGTPRKLLDAGRINSLGWRARPSLEDGIRASYQWFLKHVA